MDDGANRDVAEYEQEDDSPPNFGNKAGLIIVGERLESRDARRMQESIAATCLAVELIESTEQEKEDRGGLRFTALVTATDTNLRFAEDWSLFCAISVALRREHGFWCARVPRNVAATVVLHHPDNHLIAVDPLQSCRFSHNAFNTELLIRLLVYPSQAGYYAKKASERKRQYPTFTEQPAT